MLKKKTPLSISISREREREEDFSEILNFQEKSIFPRNRNREKVEESVHGNIKS